MTNDIVKIKSVAASQGGETEHGLMLDSSILSYTYQGSSKTVKWILDTIFTLLGGKADTVDIPTKTSDLTNDSGFLTSHQNISGKADKVSGATNGNFASLNSNGNLTDSGKKASDFAYRVHSHDQIGYYDGVVSVGIEQQEGEEDLTMIQFDSNVIKGDAVRNDIADVDYGERKILTSGAIKAALDALEARIAALES